MSQSLATILTPRVVSTPLSSYSARWAVPPRRFSQAQPNQQRCPLVPPSRGGGGGGARPFPGARRALPRRRMRGAGGAELPACPGRGPFALSARFRFTCKPGGAPAPPQGEALVAAVESSGPALAGVRFYLSAGAGGAPRVTAGLVPTAVRRARAPGQLPGGEDARPAGTRTPNPGEETGRSESARGADPPAHSPAGGEAVKWGRCPPARLLRAGGGGVQPVPPQGTVFPAGVLASLGGLPRRLARAPLNPPGKPSLSVANPQLRDC